MFFFDSCKISVPRKVQSHEDYMPLNDNVFYTDEVIADVLQNSCSLVSLVSSGFTK